MYGYELPRYAKEYQADWRRYDRFLRLRWSLDQYGAYILERKTRYFTFPDAQLMTDRAVQYKDSCRMVSRFWPHEIGEVLDYLRRTDIQAAGGAKALADYLDAQDQREWDARDRAQHDEFEMLASGLFDRHAWAEKRRISAPVQIA